MRPRLRTATTLGALLVAAPLAAHTPPAQDEPTGGTMLEGAIATAVAG